MRVCLIANQIAAWGKIGGFGTATRALGVALAARGHEVTAVVVRRAGEGQGRVEHLDGITVYGMSARETMFSGKVFAEIGADVYHSQEPTIASRHAQRSAPDAVHIITCRDPRSLREHLVELRHTNWRRRLIFPATWFYEASPWVKRAVRGADSVLMPAPSHLTPRIKHLYGEAIDPEFVPSPIELPTRTPVKGDQPMAVFVGRWDHRKRIERFFELARRFPEVRFVAVGRAHDSTYDARLRDEFGSLPNVEMPGFLPRFGDESLSGLYERAWVLVNTSAREGLPYTFLEAASWDCAILSTLDPEGFSSRFGHHAADDTMESLEHGLRELLAGAWRERGQAAGAFVRSTWSEDESVRRHLAIYEGLARP
jgi:glycosyltransferase involved in cell wall biosynthesis